MFSRLSAFNSLPRPNECFTLFSPFNDSIGMFRRLILVKSRTKKSLATARGHQAQEPIIVHWVLAAPFSQNSSQERTDERALFAYPKNSTKLFHAVELRRHVDHHASILRCNGAHRQPVGRPSCRVRHCASSWLDRGLAQMDGNLVRPTHRSHYLHWKLY